MNENDGKPPRKSPRRVFGRVRWSNSRDQTYEFTMNKDGVNIHQLNRRRKNDAIRTFEKLAAGDAVTATVEQNDFRLCFGERGVIVMKEGSKGPALLVPWAKLCNLAGVQPVLFPGADLHGSIPDGPMRSSSSSKEELLC